MSVIDSTFETKGTNLYFIDFISNTDGVVTKMTCPTGITGLNGGTRDKIDTTCLDETGAFKTYIGGFADSSEYTVPFILYKGDAGHQALFSLHESGDVVGWFCGFSDSTTAPTMDSDQENLVAPNNRTGFSFRGYIANLTIDLATNEVVRGTLTIQPRTAPVPHWAS
jgi:hypothetical protein